MRVWRRVPAREMMFLVYSGGEEILVYLALSLNVVATEREDSAETPC